MSPRLISNSNTRNLVLILITISVVALSTPSQSTTTFKALVTPLTKDSSTSLFTIALNSTASSSSFVLDISTHLPWLRCKPPSSFPHAPCGSQQCSDSNHYDPSLCSGNRNRNRNPRSKTVDSFCHCSAVSVNPVAKRCSASDLSYTDFSVSTTDGHNPLGNAIVGPVYVGCATDNLFASLPRGVAGLASLSRAPLSLVSQLQLSKQFGICLPSSDSAKGVAFIGKGPFYVLPPPGRNLNDLLQYTPLIKSPAAGGHNFEYFIGVKGIAVNQQAVKFQSMKMLGFDNKGRGGVKLSTVVPYTRMRSPLYKAFLSQYKLATSGIPRAKGPFDLCLNSTSLTSTRVGYGVPQIDLELSNGKNWTVFGANSFKQVSDDVACLAFVDGGEEAEQAVVIGSFQMEHNFLLFDLESNRLGFSSTLFFFQTTCANFNFTSSGSGV